MSVENEDRAGEGYGGYRQDPVLNAGLYISPEFSAAKEFLYPSGSIKVFIQNILDNWGREMCKQFEIVPRNPHRVSPKLDKPEHLC